MIEDCKIASVIQCNFICPNKRNARIAGRWYYLFIAAAKTRQP